MKLQIFPTLCLLCFLRASSAHREYDQRNVLSTVQNPSETFEKLPAELLNTEKLRDKRGLGLILSGLAQVFGYNVNPIQVATLPNPNSGQPANGNSGKSTNPTQQAPSSAAPSPSASTATSPASSTTIAVPRQRETIRFTGVVNFGNNTDVVSQLQQYERIFHGESTTRGPTTTLAPSTSSSASLISEDLRTITDEKSPLLSPLLVRIPLPIVPELPRPELPTEDFQLSYPETYLPIRTEQESVYRKNENTEKLTVTGKDISESKDVQSPIANNARNNNDRYNEDQSKWKKEYEERLAELERKQMEQEHKLRQQESYRDKGVGNGKEERLEEKYRNREKVTVDNSKEKDLRYKEKDNGSYQDYSEEEKEDSREKYEDRKKTQEYTPSRFTSSEKQEEDGKKYHDYENSYRPYKQYEESLPIVFSNYTGLQSNEQLPISDYYEQRKPDGLRNSYGEILDSHEVIDDGIADYYEKFKKPQTGHYESSKSRGSGGSSKEKEKVEGPEFETKKEEEALERLRQEYSYPLAENKYEEYSLEEEKEEKDNKNSKISEEPYRSGEVSKNVASYSSEQEDTPKNVKYEMINVNEKDKANSEENLNQEFDFLKYTPYIVPGRYLYAPEELEKANLRLSTSDKSSDTVNGEMKAKIATESTEIESQPKVGLSEPVPQRILSKNHHRIDQKELWPVSLDYTYDVPEETIAVPEKSQRFTDRKLSNAYQNPMINRKEKETPQRQPRLRGRVNNFTPSYTEYPESTPYFQQNLESQKPRRKSRVKSRVNDAAVSSTPSSITKTKTTVWGDRQRAKETPSIIERYKYTSNDRYPSNEQPNVEIFRSVQPEVPRLYLQPVEIVKQNNRETEPIVENYYSHVYPKENREKEVERARLQEARASSQKLVKADSFDSPKSAHNFFGFSRDDYSFDDENVGKKGNEKSAIEEEVIGLIVPEPDPYVYDESLTKFTDEPESKNGKVKVREYANKVATVKVSEQRQAHPNKPTSYVNFQRNL